MLRPKYIPLVMRQAMRRPTRTLLTVTGVALAMFLFSSVQALQEGVRVATGAVAGETTLIVYRQNRFCPAASNLPEDYRARIERIPGVVSVTPMKVVPTNCRTSLDVVTFRGMVAEEVAPRATWDLRTGSVRDWVARKDAALISGGLARRRGLRVGDQFDAGGVRTYVAGVFESDQPQEQNAVYTHLDFLQRSTGRKLLGVVTQFSVKVADPARLDEVASRIDDEFRDDRQPTQTSSERGFIARAAADIIHLIGFMRLLGWGCLAAVLALVSNAIVLNVRDRIRDHAIMQTLGFSGSLVARVVIAEGILLGLLGGALGGGTALAIVRLGSLGLTNEGLYIPLAATPTMLLIGLIIAAGAGVLASLVPAWQAARREIPTCFRAV